MTVNNVSFWKDSNKIELDPNILHILQDILETETFQFASTYHVVSYEEHSDMMMFCNELEQIRFVFDSDEVNGYYVVKSGNYLYAYVYSKDGNYVFIARVGHEENIL